MGRKYPNVQSTIALKKKTNHECECCDRRATHMVRYQVSWFRGDDECINVCPRHLQMASNDEWKRLFAHSATKAQYVSARKNAGHSDLETTRKGGSPDLADHNRAAPAETPMEGA